MSSANSRRQAPYRSGQLYGNFQYPQPPYNKWRPIHQPDFRRDRPPEPPAPTLRPNFVVQLRWDNGFVQKFNVDGLIDECKETAEKFLVFSSGPVAASLFYRQWNDALEAVVRLWKLRFDKGDSFTPRLISNFTVPSDLDDLSDRLKVLFSERVRGLMEGKEVIWCKEKLKQVSEDIGRISARLRKPNEIGVYNELTEKRRGFVAERKLIEKRLKEFEVAMKCILNYLEGVKVEFGEEESTGVFRFDGNFDASKVHCMILRECHRLKDSLPIYAYRLLILGQVFQHQILVLIGETGSGKSTQLVQFLVDSGFAANGSIVCTQPRKIAAISLAHRVREECRGCYEDNSVVCCPTFVSAHLFNSNVIFLTDHCLLQHYMNDTNLSGISCIIVDEAHERSLSTDLLLAVVKDLLSRRYDLRLIIMSATADANQLSGYFFGCGIFHVEGRNFPVATRYVPSAKEGHSGSGAVAAYVSDVVRMANEVHKTEKEGTILAFLTSQMEVEWACEKFEAYSAVALALHGKLSFEEQFQVFRNYPGKRKVIFATNVAETSLTIPGVKYVIDSGMVKESKFDPGTGTNVLKVCRISQSSANQRSGRAGRTEPGRCYRLYSECDFASMLPNQEPEICRVHLGVAVLRILALGIKNIQDFDFIDAPCSEAIDTAIRNLLQLGALSVKNKVFELTRDGRYLVKMGMEPRLGKLILNCFAQKLKREGVVLASVMANASSIFCRVGNDGDKLKSDSLKVQFCHRNGDLFTLLSVYKEWEALPREERNMWCWENSINAKSMRRCQDTVQELEVCLQKELSVIIPSYWVWSPHNSSEHDRSLKKAILSSLAENAAMYSGSDQLGYEVALTGQHVQLHPSCSLHIFGQKPQWVVFSELLSISNQYLVCVTAFDFESLSTLYPPPLFDAFEMERRKLKVQVMTGHGSRLLKKVCGKSNSNLISLVSRIRAICKDTRISLEINTIENEIQLCATSEDMEKVVSLVNNALEVEKKWLRNECMEKCLFHGSGVSPVALFGAGAEIKNLELEKRCLTVDVFQSNPVDDKELLMFLERYASGIICTVHKFTSTAQDNDCREKWGRLTFLTSDAAEKAAGLNEVELGGSQINITPSQETPGGDNRMFSFPAVKAKVCWPRRYSKGFAIVKCHINDVDFLVSDFSNLPIGGKYVRCEISTKSVDSVVIYGLDKELMEDEILEVLRNNTDRKIIDFFLVRGDAAENPPCKVSEEAIWKEICPYMPKRSLCGVQVFPPNKPNDVFTRALITFDGRMHLQAAKALGQIEGKVLPGCLSWQKIKCQQLFHSSLSCPPPVYFVINKELDSLLASFKHSKGAECKLDRTSNGSYRVKISANATKTVAEMRKPFEELMRGETIKDASLTPTICQLLLSRDGINLMRTLQHETRTHIFFDRHSQDVRIFGQSQKIAVAQQRLVRSLMIIHESKQLQVHLRGGGLPPDLMKEVVKKFGPDLHGLKEKVPEAEFTLNIRHHMITISGTKDLKQKVEEIVYEVAQMSGNTTDKHVNGSVCTICLCDVEDGFQLEGCGHMFCRLCLVEQCESAMKNLDSFPICCTHEGCRAPILIIDLRSLLSSEKMEELFRASLAAFVASSMGKYRFCPTPDCPSVYRGAEPGTAGEQFLCGACYAETCNRCHMEYHPHISCEKFQEFKKDPDSSLIEWRKGKEHVKSCPKCPSTIEKVDGCNHIECRCGWHICWSCLEYFKTSEDCYTHLKDVHQAMI